MTIRSACLFASVALAAAAAPALAQDYDPGPPPPLPEEGAWEEEWTEEPGASYAHDQDYAHDEHGRWEEHGDRHDGPPGEWRGHPMPQHGPGQVMGYPPEQRAQWLEQCRATYYRDDRGRERGQVIGGVLGAVAGGLAGREIADRDDNLAGTLIGAGVGGLAGVAIGGAIGADSGRDECETYLLRYEHGMRGYGQGYAHGAVGYHYPYPYPVMWVKVPIHTVRQGDCGCETVVEEVVVEEAAPPPVRRTKIQRIVPAPAPGKRVRSDR